jgi:hypothetical protein
LSLDVIAMFACSRNSAIAPSPVPRYTEVEAAFVIAGYFSPFLAPLSHA